MVQRDTLGPDRNRPVTLAANPLPAETQDWLATHDLIVRDPDLWLRALTHGSFNGNVSAKAGKESAGDYQRLEFLGDRVLGLAVASWLFRDGDAAEGQLSQRLNALVSGATCARIARKIGLPAHIRLGKQAREDGGADSDNILGDVMEALIGACFLEHGYDTARDIVYDLWAKELAGNAGKAKHPKSALQEWAASRRRAMPLIPSLNAPDRTTPCALPSRSPFPRSARRAARQAARAKRKNARPRPFWRNSGE